LAFVLVTNLSAVEELKVIGKEISFNDPLVQTELKPYFLPKKHPARKVLDQIFSTYPHALNNPDTFVEAGFYTHLVKRSSRTRSARMCLASHPLVPGYLFKVYLNSETKLKRNEGWYKLATRCEGAENIRKLIKAEKMRHFVVPDKWLYRLPVDETSGKEQQPVILMETDMDLVQGGACREAWKKVGKEELRELFSILSHGYSSPYLVNNIPLTRDGKFACIDTEYAKRKNNLKHAQHYFSDEMQVYWEKLVKPVQRVAN